MGTFSSPRSTVWRRVALAVAGVTWSIVTIAAAGPATALAPAALHTSATAGVLTSISCPTTSFCMAVDSVGALTLEHKTWHQQKISAHGALSDISCSSATSCMAVGSYQVGGTSELVSVAELWNGKIWRAVRPAGPGGDLSTVSCTKADWCVGVGSANGQTAAQAWNGTRWTLLKTPNP